MDLSWIMIPGAVAWAPRTWDPGVRMPARIKVKSPATVRVTKITWAFNPIDISIKCIPRSMPSSKKANPKLGNQWRKTSLKTNPDETRIPVDRKMAASPLVAYGI